MAARKLSQHDPAKLLAGMPLFAGTGSALLERLSPLCKVLKLPGHAPIYRTGDPVRLAKFLVTGSIKRCTLLTDAVERVLELVRPGQLFALSELFGARTYRSFATTLEPCLILSLPVDALLTAAGKHPALAQRLLETLARQQFAIEFEHVSHHALSGTQRVLDYLLHLAGDQRAIAGETTVRLDASKKLIAAQLDMTPETFSRTLRQLTLDGVIVVNGRAIHIQNATLAIDGVKAREDKTAKLRYPRVDKKPVENPISSAALVNLCGRHRMLSQRLASAWCVVARNLEPESGSIALRKLHGQFERNLAQVKDLPLSDNLRSLCDTLEKRWVAYRELLMAAPAAATNAKKVFERSEQMLAAADRLTAAAATEAAHPAARFVNVSGRNRMLTGRLTKLFLFYDMGVMIDKAQTLMNESRTEFLANMAKLRVHGADTPEIMAQLAIDTEQWHAFGSVIDAAIAATPDRQLTHKVLDASDELLRHVDTTVKLYEKLAEREFSRPTPTPRLNRRPQ
jgi:CRP-like cAMP-binding protein